MWKRYCAESGSRKPDLPGSPTSAAARKLVAAYVTLVLGLAVYLAVGAISGGLPVGWAAYWCGLVILMAAMPWAPAFGLGAFVALAYGTPRYSETFDQLAQFGLLDWTSVLVFGGCAVWMIRECRRPRAHPFLYASMALFVFWIGISAVVNWSQGAPFHPSIRHHPVNFIYALALFLVASQVLGERSAALQFAFIFCSSLILRGIIQGVDGIFLDGDIAPLAVMALPLALMGVLLTGPFSLRIAFSLMALALIAILSLTLNRAAGVAFVVVVLLLWWQSRYRWRVLAVSLPGIAAAGFWFAKSDYWARFRAIWSDEGLRSQLDRATITERLELWRGALGMIQDNPWFGVGLSNFRELVAGYGSPRLDGMAVHNSLLHVASETGIPGLLLYTVLFAAGFVVLSQAKSYRSLIAWPDIGARMVQSSLAAYLVAGLFITRHDMILAYLLLGWAAGLRISARDALPARQRSRMPRPG